MVIEGIRKSETESRVEILEIEVQADSRFYPHAQDMGYVFKAKGIIWEAVIWPVKALGHRCIINSKENPVIEDSFTCGTCGLSYPNATGHFRLLRTRQS